jgi:hypothetical protein
MRKLASQRAVIRSRSTITQSPKRAAKKGRPAMKDTITIGMDLGDKTHIAVVFDAAGTELEVTKVTNTKTALQIFQPIQRGRGRYRSMHTFSMDQSIA